MYVIAVRETTSSYLFLNQDTAMEIDSSDEDEKPSASNGFAFKGAELPRRMGLRGNLRRR